MAAKMPSAARPKTVVFVDDGRMSTFYQFAARLRKLGTRVVRITTVNDAQSLMASKLVFDRSVTLPAQGVAEAIRSEFAKENVVDVQFVETLKDIVSAGLPVLAPAVATMVQRRIQVMDKEYAGNMFAAAGVATPPRALFSEMDARTFAEHNGFPIVIKDRTGYGGIHVTIVETLDELDAMAGPYAGIETAYLEKYIEGDKVNFGAVLGFDGLLQGLCYKTLDWVRPVGPSSVVEVYEDAALSAAGRRAVEAVGVPGLVNVNFMLDVDGGLWAIDLNARVFGGLAAYLACGIDLTSAYMSALGMLPSVAARVPSHPITLMVFPTSLSELVERGQIGPLLKEFRKESTPYWKWLGPRYMLSELLATFSALSNARRRR